VLERVVEQACEAGIAANAADGASSTVTTVSSTAIARLLVVRVRPVIRSIPCRMTPQDCPGGDEGS